MSSQDQHDQLPLGQVPRASPGGRPANGNAVQHPVARVVIDTPLAHLDRPFEYAVPQALDDRVQAGVRVRVRFAGRDHDGYVVDRVAEAEHPGALQPVRRVVGDDVVLTPHVLRVGRRVADHYAGTLSDVLRLAIPPRHARVEGELPPTLETGGPEAPTETGGVAWADYPAGEALLRRLSRGDHPAAAWSTLPCRPPERDWPAGIAEAVAATLSSGRGAVIVVPDRRDLVRVSEALRARLGADQHVQLSADLGPGERYRAWLSLLRGHRHVVVGTRAAAYAPVRRPGLFLVWDDGDDLLHEPRSPYPHVREVLRLRAEDANAGLVVAGFVHSPEVHRWVQDGWMRSVGAATATVRRVAPRVVVAGEGRAAEQDPAAGSARIPTAAWRVVHKALGSGPVLVQVPRRGYGLAVQCAQCRHPVRCTVCGGPTQLPGPHSVPTCTWCAQESPSRACPECGSSRLRSPVVGEHRTAEEIGRAFPGVPVRTSRAGQVLTEVPHEPSIVVATPGAEPPAVGGYTAVLLLDGWALLDRPGLDAHIEAWRRWSAACALARAEDGPPRVVLTGVPPHAGVRSVEALVRWDPAWLLEAELAERRELQLPPFRRTARVAGDAALVGALVETLAGGGDTGIDALGPTPAPARPVTAGSPEQQSHLVLRAQDASGVELLRVARDLRAGRSASKAAGHLTVVLDPDDLGV